MKTRFWLAILSVAVVLCPFTAHSGVVDNLWQDKGNGSIQPSGGKTISGSTMTIGTLNDIYYVDSEAELIAAIASTKKKIKITTGFAITPATHTIAGNGVTIEIAEGVVITTTGTDFSLKITGNDCAIVGPGTIQTPDTPAIAGSAIAVLRKATIWNTGNRFMVSGVTFQNSISYSIFNEGGENLKIINNKAFGGFDDYDIADGNSHFFCFTDGGSNHEAYGNYIENYVMGFGCGTWVSPAGAVFNIHDNIFHNIGQHPIYIANGGDRSVISGNVGTNCGGWHALTGNYITVIGDNAHLDSTLWTSGTTYQGGLSMRNATGCIIKGNTFTGNLRVIPIGFENLSGGVSTVGNIVAENYIYSTTGEVVAGIRLGSQTVTTDLSFNRVINNTVIVPVLAASASSGIIRLDAKEADQNNWNIIEGNFVSSNTTFAGIEYLNGGFGSIKNNIVNNSTATGAIYGIYMLYAHDCEVSGNIIKNLPTAGTTWYGIKEYGTNAQVYNNRYINNKTYSATTTSNHMSYTLIAGNGSKIENPYDNEAIDLNAATTFRIHHGHVFHLTASGGVRNFNPSTTDAVWPLNYRVDIYNDDGTNTITFDSTGLNVAVAAGKHGVFSYNGTAWKGSQVD